MKKGDKQTSLLWMEKALSFYKKNYKRLDPYTHPVDKIYLGDIEEALVSLR
jgi:hypothetical protein